MLVDSHCHLDFPDLIQNEADMLARMADNGVTHALCVAVKLETLAGVIGAAERHPNVFASVGVHPDNADCEEPDEARLLELAAHPKVVAIGETGLDYYWHKDAPEWQRARFRTHIRAARRCAKPLIIHTRDSAADTLRLMQEEGAGEAGGVMHCFSGSIEVARQCMDMNFYISFGGPVTFKNAKKPKEVAKEIPLDRLLIETDCPYLAPNPNRGKRNDSTNLKYVVEKIAEIKNLPPETVAEISEKNAKSLFFK